MIAAALPQASFSSSNEHGKDSTWKHNASSVRRVLDCLLNLKRFEPWADFTSPALKPTCRRLGAKCARCHRDWLPPRPHPTSTIFLRCPVLVLSSTRLFLFCLAVLRGLNLSGYGLSVPPRAQRRPYSTKNICVHGPAAEVPVE